MSPSDARLSYQMLYLRSGSIVVIMTIDIKEESFCFESLKKK